MPLISRGSQRGDHLKLFAGRGRGGGVRHLQMVASDWAGRRATKFKTVPGLTQCWPLDFCNLSYESFPMFGYSEAWK